eukprot:CAMPEP_0198146130 /NCGR_PEP_ID=MMETSP1443-20131203/27593_1 /TAXON_ID=186043 /ORGANISM="Entomoneis sp., Strain CCMP2396" /LENGTH=240 /DNA_ID=CAMNT_0043809977 /DNA_START=152 /DNA_END=874 /DNA_ORIENTATION=-
MGNGASTDNAGGESSGENPTMTATNGSAAATTTSNRRIIKAVKPTPNPLEIPTPGGDEKKNGDDDVDDSLDNSIGNMTKTIAESPSVARELELENLEQQKQGRLEEMKNSQRAKREKRLEERRKKDGVGGGDDDGGAVAEKSNTAQPNPFSRFLSVFSVEPKHPEHKRAYEISADDDPEPPGKIPRADDDMDVRDGTKAKDSDDDNKKHMCHFLFNPSTMLAAALAAIVAGVFMRVSKPK